MKNEGLSLQKSFAIFCRRLYNSVGVIRVAFSEEKKKQIYMDLIQNKNWDAFNSGPIDWDFISRLKLPIDFVRKYCHKLHWRTYCFDRIVPDEIIEEFYNCIDWEIISENRLSVNILRKFPDMVNWKVLSSSREIFPENVLMEFKDKFIWNLILIWDIPSDNFMEQVGKYICWDNAVFLSLVSEEFIEKYRDIVDWKEVSSHVCMTEEFIRKHIEEVHWGNICKFQILSDSFIEEFEDYIDWDTLSLNLPGISNYIMGRYEDKLDWSSIFAYQNVSEDLIIKNKKDEYLSSIAEFQELSPGLIRELAEYGDMPWYTISRCQKLPEDLIEEFKYVLDLNDVSLHNKLPQNIIEEFGIEISSGSWLYIDEETKFDRIKNAGYEFDDQYVYGYKVVRALPSDSKIGRTIYNNDMRYDENDHFFSSYSAIYPNSDCFKLEIGNRWSKWRVHRDDIGCIHKEMNMLSFRKAELIAVGDMYLGD